MAAAAVGPILRAALPTVLRAVGGAGGSSAGGGASGMISGIASGLMGGGDSGGGGILGKLANKALDAVPGLVKSIGISLMKKDDFKTGLGRALVALGGGDSQQMDLNKSPDFEKTQAPTPQFRGMQSGVSVDSDVPGEASYISNLARMGPDLGTAAEDFNRNYLSMPLMPPSDPRGRRTPSRITRTIPYSGIARMLQERTGGRNLGDLEGTQFRVGSDGNWLGTRDGKPVLAGNTDLPFYNNLGTGTLHEDTRSRYREIIRGEDQDIQDFARRNYDFMEDMPYLPPTTASDDRRREGMPMLATPEERRDPRLAMESNRRSSGPVLPEPISRGSRELGEASSYRPDEMIRTRNVLKRDATTAWIPTSEVANPSRFPASKLGNLSVTRVPLELVRQV